jgi:hypothetical protein
MSHRSWRRSHMVTCHDRQYLACFEADPFSNVEFTENVGNVRRRPLNALWCIPFERANPVRSFPPFRGQASFSGLYYPVT